MDVLRMSNIKRCQSRPPCRRDDTHAYKSAEAITYLSQLLSDIPLDEAAVMGSWHKIGNTAADHDEDNFQDSKLELILASRRQQHSWTKHIRKIQRRFW